MEAGEDTVLDCSMVKLEFRWRGPSRIRVFLTSPHQVLLCMSSLMASFLATDFKGRSVA